MRSSPDGSYNSRPSILRVHFSHAAPSGHGAGAYHFGFYESDVRYARNEGAKATHVVFASLPERGTGVVEDVPLVIVPINSVFVVKGRKPRPRQVLDPDYFRAPKNNSREHTTMTAYLEQHPRGWQLRIPTPSLRKKREAVIELPAGWLVG